MFKLRVLDDHDLKDGPAVQVMESDSERLPVGHRGRYYSDYYPESPHVGDAIEINGQVIRVVDTHVILSNPGNVQITGRLYPALEKPDTPE